MTTLITARRTLARPSLTGAKDEGNCEAVHADVWIVQLREGYELSGVLVFAMEASEQARLKEHMARVAEQHATAIEEPQSTNEELQAANAELATLNSELGSRTSELNRIGAFHRNLLDNLEDGLAVLDREGVVLTWNLAAEWGLQAQHVVNRPFFTLPNEGALSGSAMPSSAREPPGPPPTRRRATRVRGVRPAAGSAASAPAAQPDRQPQRVRRDHGAARRTADGDALAGERRTARAQLAHRLPRPPHAGPQRAGTSRRPVLEGRRGQETSRWRW
jgi:hypothetical protein